MERKDKGDSMNNTQVTKQAHIYNILRHTPYTSESDVYKKVAADLAKLSTQTLFILKLAANDKA